MGNSTTSPGSPCQCLTTHSNAPHRPMLYYAQKITFQEITLCIRQILQYLKNCCCSSWHSYPFSSNTMVLEEMVTRNNLMKFVSSLFNEGIWTALEVKAVHSSTLYCYKTETIFKVWYYLKVRSWKESIQKFCIDCADYEWILHNLIKVNAFFLYIWSYFTAIRVL